MENPQAPKWLKFLEEINKKILEVWNNNSHDVLKSSKELAKILQKMLAGDQRQSKWSSSKDVARYIDSSEPNISHVKYSALLESISKGKLQISPFTFWSFIFALPGQYDEERLKTIIAFYGANDADQIAKGLISGNGCACGQVIDTYLQHIADLSENAVKWWSFFESLMSIFDNMNNQWREEINQKIKKCQTFEGIGDAAIRNLLFFIRPDLTFTVDKKGMITNIANIPAYWTTAPVYYISEIKKIPQFSKFEKSDGGVKCFLQYNLKDKNGISFHYEIIVGKERKDSPFKIFTEFHVESKNNANRELLNRLKTELSSCESEHISIDHSWREAKNGFAIRYGDGVAVLDENGEGIDFNQVLNALAAQMDNLYAIINNKLENFLAMIDSDWCLEEKLEMLKGSKQLILTGAPGTGKTYTAIQMAEELIKRKGGTWAKVQFHPGYDYSDFIIGLKPEVTDKGKVTFKWKDGVFKKFADEAKNKAEPYIFIIDEINRADLSRVFGEVFSLLEEEYRYPNKEKGITLPNGENFILSDNLYIIGTMNDIDRSVESMDFALRRRFSWYEVKAEDSEHIVDVKKKDSEEYKIPDENNRKNLKDIMRCLNDCISGKDSQLDLKLGVEYQLGGAYFLNFAKYQNEKNSWEQLWDNHIAIILDEYLRGRKDRQPLICALRNKYFAILGDNK